MKTELLAPAGQPDAGYAALQYGADAVYCGLGAFSARAEAVNFTPEELAVFARHAHSLAPARRVYCTLNTLLRDGEIGRAVDTMATALDCGADAIIVQDLGLAAVAREHFPNAELHASTQMAIHSLDGARKAKELGFRRVTLARELTLEEIADICAHSGVEIETFVHGTLCYAYSGLCLFSSMTTGRSGNRGRCVYSCREAAAIPWLPDRGRGGGGRAHPFSLKDMALEEDVLRLAEAGVASFKIEGRKKSPLYVAATVDYYRRLIDGTFAPGEREECRARLQTIFARPWTKLFLHARRNPEAADTEVVGHRGAALGKVGALARTPAGAGIRFRAGRAVERHDGLQIDIPGEARPFGFAVDNLYMVEKAGMRPVFAAPAGAEIAVSLPEDAPPLSPGLPVYQSSSQAVKRSYPFARPRSGVPEADTALDMRVSLEQAGEDACAAVVAARADCPAWLPGGETGKEREVAVSLREVLPAFPARDGEGAAAAAKKAFARTGGSRFVLRGWEFANPCGVFVRPGDWNALRRELLARLEDAYAKARESALAGVRAACAADGDSAENAFTESVSGRDAFPGDAPVWSLVVGDAGALEGFGAADRDALEEIVLPHTAPADELARLADAFGEERIRLFLPLVARAEEAEAAAVRARKLAAAGWRRWLVPGLGQRAWLDGVAGLDLCADWSLYALNRQAVKHLANLGFSAFSFSPEDDGENISRLLRACSGKNRGKGWLTVYGDVPLFLSAACAHSHLGLCNRLSCEPFGGVPPHGIDMEMEKSGSVSVLPLSCGSLVLGRRAFSLLSRVGALGARRLRADLRWRARSPEEVLRIWRAVREGTPPPGMETTEGNFSRLLQ